MAPAIKAETTIAATSPPDKLFCIIEHKRENLPNSHFQICHFSVS